MAGIFNVGEFVLAFDHFFGSVYQNYLLGSGVITPDAVEQDKHGVWYVKPDSDVEFYFKLCLFPASFWKVTRVSNDGWYVPNALDLGKPDYQKYAVGNVRNEPLDTLFQRALESAAFEQFWTGYLEKEESKRLG